MRPQEMEKRDPRRTADALISSETAALKRASVSSGESSVSNAAYSATEAIPTGVGGEKKRRAWGLNPAEYPTGMSALRTMRAKSRSTSMWERKRFAPVRE